MAPRPTQFPRQLVVHVTDETRDRIDADAAKRGDGSVSGAARRLIELGTLLADALEADAPSDPSATTESDAAALYDLLNAAEAVR